MDTDEQLWARMLDGDGEALRGIFLRHGDRVLTQCARWMGTRQDADSVTNEVFVQAWRARRRVRFVGGSVLPWLLVTANNVARRQSRATRRRQRLHVRLVATGDAHDTVPDPAVQIVDRDEADHRARALADGLQTLSAHDQQVIGLCDLGGLTYSQAAEVIGVPIGTVRSRLARARGRLRVSLEASIPSALAERSSQTTTTADSSAEEIS